MDFEIRDFSEGYIDSVNDNLLPPNASRNCQNFISRVIGSLQKRTGQARLNATALDGAIRGLYTYYYGTNRKLIVAHTDNVNYWNGTGFTDLKTGLDTTAQVMFETCVNYMVSFNGVDAPWKWDGTTVSALANAPADGQFCVLHKEKLFTVKKSEPSTLYWSDSFAPETWQAVNYWDIKKGDGDVVTSLQKFLGELVVFKRRSVHSLAGTSLDDFRLNEIDSRIGCVGPFAVVASGMYLYFVSDEGICVFNGMKVTNLSEDRIPKLWGNINKQYLYKAAVGVWNGLIWFALPEGSSTYNNLLLIYDFPSDSAYSGKFWPWRGINASCFQQYNDGTQTVLYSGDSSAGYVNRQDVGTDDFGVAINAFYECKAFDMGKAEIEKKAKKVFIQDSPETLNHVDLQISKDYGPFGSLELKASDDMIREFWFASSGRWRYLAPKLSHNALGACEVRGILMPYKAKSKPKVRVT